jgi:sulfane dehydrogenase subunit SoxC
MDRRRPGRRGFLKQGAALAGLAIPAGALIPGAVRVEAAADEIIDQNSTEAALYGRRSRFVTTVRNFEGQSHRDGMVVPKPDPTRRWVRAPTGESIGTLTPASLHYTMMHDYGIPDIDPTEHKLIIHGMVERELVFTVDDLKRMPFVSRHHFIECDGNRPNPNGKSVGETHGRMSCSEWTGVPLSYLLNEAGIKNGATWMISEGAEAGRHMKSLMLTKALDDVIVAYGQNGEPVRPDQGYPMRLLVPGFQGIESVKWLRRIKVVDQPYNAIRDDQPGYLTRDVDTDQTDFGPKSVITYPSGTQFLPSPGTYTISGLAWSGCGSVKKVEVSTDGGKTYQMATFAGPQYSKAFSRFYYVWKWDGKEAMLQSRCVDERGQIQPTEAEFAASWKMTRAEVYKYATRLGHCNWIMPWKVNGNGTVVNGLMPANFVDPHGG